MRVVVEEVIADLRGFGSLRIGLILLLRANDEGRRFKLARAAKTAEECLISNTVLELVPEPAGMPLGRVYVLTGPQMLELAELLTLAAKVILPDDESSGADPETWVSPDFVAWADRLLTEHDAIYGGDS